MTSIKFINRMLVLVFVLSIVFSCSDDDGNEPVPSVSSDYTKFSSLNELLSKFEELSALENQERLESLLDSLQVNNEIPFSIGDSVLFIYFGNASSVSWAGDFNRWNSESATYEGLNIGESDLWVLKKSFPADARLDYKIVVNGSNWILDPKNSYRQVSGFGPNSELRMPEWNYPEETILNEGVVRGSLSDNKFLQSNAQYLGYKVQYKVYTPYNYDELDSCAVVYITDGHEYADNALGATLTVMDNIIFNNETEPLIAVFIDPRNPDNLSENRRMNEYRANMDFANFVANELVPSIDLEYKTIKNASSRAIMGTSLGGWNSAFFGFQKSDVFQKIIIHSPAFDNQIISDYETSAKLDLDIFMSTGVINDTENAARAMKTVMENKGYNLNYVEVNQGHSWGNWRALIDDPLKFHFSK